ncbi:MAG: nucleotidyltransferase domain-containing protein [Candidatus Magasanikbacteria bacterium]
MSKAQVKKIIKKYTETLIENGLPVKGTYLFGSHALGKSNKWSDIDVAVVVDENKANFWKKLSLYSKIGLAVDRRLEAHIFSTLDFKNDSDPMVFEIKRTGLRVV